MMNIFMLGFLLMNFHDGTREGEGDTVDLFACV